MTAPSPDPSTHAGAGTRYPQVRREELVEDLHGHRVADPYRWLEAPSDDAEVGRFIAEQNAVSAAHLADLPHRDAFRRRLRDLWDHPRRGAPWRRGPWWFQIRNDGLQDQDVLWCARATTTADAEPDGADDGDGAHAGLPPDGAWRILLDPNTWSDDGTASLSGLAPTDDGERLAFARSDAGSDWSTWRVVEVATGTVLDDEVPWAKFTGAAWLPDGSGFLYGRYPRPEPGAEHAAANRDQQLRLHVVGTDAADDAVVHERPDQPEWGFQPHVSHDGRWLVLTVWRGTDPTNRVHVAPITSAGIGPVRPLLDAGDARYDPLGVVGDDLLLVTDLDAPLGRVVAVSLTAVGEAVTRDAVTGDAGTGDAGTGAAPSGPGTEPGTGSPATQPPLRELVAETDDRLEDAALVGAATADEPGWLVCRRLHHATARLAVHDPRDGRHRHDVALPGPGSVGSLTGGRHETSAHLTFETFAAPAAILRHDLAVPATVTVWTPASDEPSSDPSRDDATGDTASGPDVDRSEVVVDQVRIHHDGVAVPLFVVHRADVVPDGCAATILWGYGGFDIPVTPMFRAPWRAWVDAGGVLAVACLRGGGEYGRTWHDDGRRAVKQHVFDDALACAAWLTGRRRDEVTASALTDGADTTAVWSAPERLGIEGGSNGGLLVGACLTQEPASFGSAVPQVGVLDMVRFHRFTIGWAWTSDYGSPDEPDDLGVLLAYSPYHRLVPGTAYPPTLVTTGDTDDRVVPAHSFKFAAALQHAQAGGAPTLLRVDTSAGHGAGKPVSKQLEERADVLAFHAHHLGLPATAG